MNKLNYRWLTLSLVILLMGVIGTGIAAQEIVTVDPHIIGDTEAESLEVVRSYLETQDPNLLAEDVAYFEAGTVAPVIGRDFLTQTNGLFYNQAFADTLATPLRYIVADEGYVTVEMEFTGINTGPFVDQPPTDIQVLIPMVGIYQVETGQIVRISLYYDTSQLYTQLGYAHVPGVVPPAHAPLIPAQQLPSWVGDILEQPAAYYGQRIVVDGYVGRAVDADSFILYESRFLAPNYEVLVITNTEEAEDFIQLADTRVRVEGTVYQFGSEEMNVELGRQLDSTAFAEFDGSTIIIADSVINVDVVQTIGHIVDNPEAFYGQEVTVNGLIGDAVGPQAFTLYQDQLIGIRGEVLVINNSGQELDFATLRDTRLRVRGTVYNPETDAQIISEQAGISFDDPVFSDYRDMPVIVAEEMLPVQEF